MPQHSQSNLYILVFYFTLFFVLVPKTSTSLLVSSRTSTSIDFNAPILGTTIYVPYTPYQQQLATPPLTQFQQNASSPSLNSPLLSTTLNISFSFLIRDAGSQAYAQDQSESVILDATPIPNAQARNSLEEEFGGFLIKLRNRGTYSSFTLQVAGATTLLLPYLVASYEETTVSLVIFLDPNTPFVDASVTPKMATPEWNRYMLPPIPMPDVWPTIVSVGRARADGQSTWNPQVDWTVYDIHITTSAYQPPNPWLQATTPLYVMHDPPIHSAQTIGVHVGSDTSSTTESAAPPTFPPTHPIFNTPIQRAIRISFSFEVASPWQSWFLTSLGTRQNYPSVFCQAQAVGSTGNNNPNPALLRVGVEPGPDFTVPSGRLHITVGDGQGGISRMLLVDVPPIHGNTQYRVEFVMTFNTDNSASTSWVRVRDADSMTWWGYFAVTSQIGVGVLPPQGFVQWSTTSTSQLISPLVAGGVCAGLSNALPTMTDFVLDDFVMTLENTYEVFTQATPAPTRAPPPSTARRVLEAMDAGMRPRLYSFASQSLFAQPSGGGNPNSHIIGIYLTGEVAITPNTNSLLLGGLSFDQVPDACDLPLISIGTWLEIYVGNCDVMARPLGVKLLLNGNTTEFRLLHSAFDLQPQVGGFVFKSFQMRIDRYPTATLFLMMDGVGTIELNLGGQDVPFEALNSSLMWLGRSAGNTTIRIADQGWQVRRLEIYSLEQTTPLNLCPTQSTKPTCEAYTLDVCTWIPKIGNVPGHCVESISSPATQAPRTAEPTLLAETISPTAMRPSRNPTTLFPSNAPTKFDNTNGPTITAFPTIKPSKANTNKPTHVPTHAKTKKPSKFPKTKKPTNAITQKPSKFHKSKVPSRSPIVLTKPPSVTTTHHPTTTIIRPTISPTHAHPTYFPTTQMPSRTPITNKPTFSPSQSPSPVSLCSNGLRDVNETDIDCGGSTTGCPRCGYAFSCLVNGDCVETLICTSSGRCGFPSEPPTPLPTNQPNTATPSSSPTVPQPTASSPSFMPSMAVPTSWRPTASLSNYTAKPTSVSRPSSPTIAMTTSPTLFPTSRQTTTTTTTSPSMLLHNDTTSPTTNGTYFPASTSLSTEAWIGIGVGIGAIVIMCIICVVAIVVLRRRDVRPAGTKPGENNQRPISSPSDRVVAERWGDAPTIRITRRGDEARSPVQSFSNGGGNVGTRHPSYRPVPGSRAAMAEAVATAASKKGGGNGNPVFRNSFSHIPPAMQTDWELL